MSEHTTFHTGGKADIYVTPRDTAEVQKVIDIKNKYNIPITVFGNGSNTIVTDKGIRGIVLALKKLNTVEVDDENQIVTVGGGYAITKLSSAMAELGYSGLEYAFGIPGTIGGAVYMNAGAFGGETKDIVLSVDYLSIDDNKIQTIEAKDCDFGYRHSIFQTMKNVVILSAKLKLTKGNKEEILAKMQENKSVRSAKQPITLPSAGSIFRREDGIIVAKLIDDSGLKGYKIGGAEVSKLHAGFIVNVDNATPQDVLDLMEHIKTVIKEKYDVDLHEEVKIIGER